MNREQRRAIDLDARRSARKRETIPVRFMEQDWEFPASPPLAALDAIEHNRIGDAVRALLGKERGAELLATDADVDDLTFLFEKLYGDGDDVGESSASPDS